MGSCGARGAGRGGAGVPGRVARRAWRPGARSLAAPIPRHRAPARAFRSPKFAGRCGSTPARPGSPRAPGARPAPETRGAPGGGRAARGRGGAGPGRLHPSAPSAACPGGLGLLLPNFSLRSLSLALSLSLFKPHPSGVTAVSPNPQSRSHLTGCGAPSLRIALSVCANGRGMFRGGNGHPAHPREPA